MVEIGKILPESGKLAGMIFPTYLPISHIAESERGNKQYFNLGLISKLLAPFAEPSLYPQDNVITILHKLFRGKRFNL
jgi:hypothetical protein